MKDKSTASIYDFFNEIDEPYAAGLFQSPERNLFFRHCNALAHWYETAKPPVYKTGEKLYPDLRRHFDYNYAPHAVRPSYANTYECNLKKLKEKCENVGNSDAFEAMSEFTSVSYNKSGWTHGSPNYRRVIREGLDSYEQRIKARPGNTNEEKDFKEGLLRLVEGIRTFWNNCIDYLCSVDASDELICAMKKVPFSPAESYYEGLVAWNAVFYFDGCDNLGCLDSGLAHLYNGEDLTDVIAEMFANIDAADTWSCAIGPACNEITKQAIKAVRGKRRPLLELRVDENTPDDIWQLAAENLSENSTNPSFYNEKGIHDMLKARFPFIPDEDLLRFCGGGCTETNLEGLTRAGGTDENINLLKVFEKYLYENLSKKETFEEFFEGLIQAEENEIDTVLNRTEEVYRHRAEYLPCPIRTLLFDDCIDKGRDYFNGGTRYSYPMNSESGLINVIDSLSAVKNIYYDKKLYSSDDFLSLLKAEDEKFFRLLNECPAFGTDDDEVDKIGVTLATRVFSVYRNKKPTLDFLDGFTLTEHQFVRYEACGKNVGATPDGRRAGEPTCDSLAALRGKAVKGPTAMLRSAAKLPQNLVDGISVVNLTLQKNNCGCPAIIKGLVLGYFKQGGMQLQVTATSAEELKDALINPEKHKDLLVRVGGYSEYFNRLSDPLKRAIVERNVHELG